LESSSNHNQSSTQGLTTPVKNTTTVSKHWFSTLEKPVFFSPLKLIMYLCPNHHRWCPKVTKKPLTRFAREYHWKSNLSCYHFLHCLKLTRKKNSQTLYGSR
jgi:hypothetical protein